MLTEGLRTWLSRARFVVLAFAALLFGAAPAAVAGSGHITFTLSAPGVAVEQPDTLLVAVRLSNTSDKTALKVKIDSIRLRPAALTSPTGFPVTLGDIAADRNVVVQADFLSDKLKQGKNYRLEIRGSYRVEDRDEDGHRWDKHRKHKEERREFKASTVINLPPLAPGSNTLTTTTVPPNKVTGGGFPPQTPSFDNEVNTSRWTVPTG